MIYGNDNILHPEYFPLLRPDTTVHYEGSIDKTGANADWDWSLYQDQNGEWVLFEVEGAGCIENFVQHRYLQSPEVTFRFYFDHEETPRFEIKNTEFGEKYPFLEPLASRFIGYGPAHDPTIRVVRSYVPMPFAKACKVTSSLKLENNCVPGGGWGHILYQRYPDDAGIRTFTADPTDSKSFQDMYDFWKQRGVSPYSAKHAGRHCVSDFVLPPHERKVIYARKTSAAVIGIRIRTAEYRQSDLKDLHVTAVWDGIPSVHANFGCFFMNELGCHSTEYLLAHMHADGDYANFFPMPFSDNAEIALVNTGDRAVTIAMAEVTDTEEYQSLYTKGNFGYFTTSPYYPKRHTEGADSIIADIRGSGHMAGAVITGYGHTSEDRASCEGDVRVHIDGKRTPQIESDGSESYVCHGWGFNFPPSCHALAGYDSVAYYCTNVWSLARTCMDACYPFRSSLRFGIESAGNNDEYMYHSGMIFYYDSRKGISEHKIADIDTGSECLTAAFEGDDDHIPVTLHGSYGKTVSFDVELPAHTHTLVLRRVSDQQFPRQKAKVLVDGTECPSAWLFADSNPHKRWLEDEYMLPSRLVAGKNRLHIDIIPTEVDGNITWNAFGISVLSIS